MKIDNIYIINLDKDNERYNESLIQAKKISFKQPIRISGIYGKNLTDKEFLELPVDKLYSKIGLKSAIGCALSHVKAWQTMIDNNDESAIFLEDDVLIDDNFIDLFNSMKIPNDYYIIYLGSLIGSDIEKKYSLEFPLARLYLGKGYTKKVKKINDNVYVPALPLGLHGYILSNIGAKYLLDNIKKDKIYNHIDAQIIKYLYNVPSYAINPQLIHQQNVTLENSNNINYPYPIIINRNLNQKDKHGIPLNYKLNIGVYEYNGYIFNIITLYFIIFGIILALLKFDIKTIFISFLLFSVLEFSIGYSYYIKNNKIFLKYSLISFILILMSYLIIIKLKKLS